MIDIGVTPWYCTAEEVMQALSSPMPSRLLGAVVRAIRAQADPIHRRTGQLFWPWTGTRYVDWPDPTIQPGPTWTIRLPEPGLVSLASATAGGTALTVADLLLRPEGGPPYRRIEVDRSSSTAWNAGSTPQRAIALAGVWGWRADEASAGTLGADATSSATTVDVTPATAAEWGIGSVLRVGTERMIVTARSSITTTATLSGAMTASGAARQVAISDGTLVAIGETITVDAERMRVLDISGSTITVDRAVDGTVLAAHSTSTTIYAPRRCTITRGALGTTAAAHTAADAVYEHLVPDGVRSLCRQASIAQVLAEGAGMLRTAGTGDNVREASGRSMTQAWAALESTYRRRGRTAVVV